MDLPRYVQDIERELIRSALERTGGNKHQAAQLLSIKRTTLVEKAKRLAREHDQPQSSTSSR